MSSKHRSSQVESQHPSSVEPLLTFRAAADALGVPYFKVQRAARRGLFPVYRLLNQRPLVRVSEIVAAIERTREGGQDAPQA